VSTPRAGSWLKRAARGVLTGRLKFIPMAYSYTTGVTLPLRVNDANLACFPYEVCSKYTIIIDSLIHSWYTIFCPYFSGSPGTYMLVITINHSRSHVEYNLYTTPTIIPFFCQMNHADFAMIT